MAVQKEVKVKVATEEELDGVEALELRIDRLNKQRIQIAIDIASQKLEDTQAEIEKLKQEKAELEVGVDDSKIKEIDAKIAQLDQESLDLQLTIETSELKKAQAEVESLDNTEINLQMSVQNFSQGISQSKQGISELKQNMDEVAQAGMQSEQNKAFLRMNLGADKAKQTYQDISDIVASMPGDDNTMRSVLSTAQALGNNLNTEEMKAATTTMADYMSGSATMGKQALESQQDIMKYLLDGNTAELERGSIVSSQVDKLKEATTFQERQAAMQAVLNELGYGGISNQDTMLNKQAEWEGMIYNSQDALSSMWLNAERGAMDYILKLNDSTNGMLGMGIVAAQMATGPLLDMFGGVAQIGMGLKGFMDGIGILRNLSIVTYAQAAASKIAAAAQWLWNLAMDANPVVLVVLAIVALIAVLGYLYFNNEQVRQSIDALGQTLMGFGQWVYNGAIYWLNQLYITLMNLWNYIFTLGGLIPANVSLTGNQVIDTILRVIGFMLTLPLQLGMIFMNIIAKALGFGDNFSQRMITGASNAVKGFLRYIQQLPGIVMGEFNRVLGLVNDFINSLPSRVWEMGVAIIDALKKSLGIGSPGHMFYMVEGEFKRIDDLTQKTRFDTSRIGKDMVDNFNPVLGVGFDYKDTVNALLSKSNNQSNKEPPVINFYFNDTVVDDDSRMERIANYITRKLMFDNKTAGRTV